MREKKLSVVGIEPGKCGCAAQVFSQLSHSTRLMVNVF